MVSPTEARVTHAVHMGQGIIAMEFDSEVLVNQAPTLQLANGKTATFMTQYDTKTLLFTVDPEDIGQKVTGLAEGAIESIHNLPVSVVGSKITHGVNGSEAATNEVPEYTGQLATAGEGAPTVEKPEFTDRVNGEEAVVTEEAPEYTGQLATVGEEPAPIVEKMEFKGGVNSVLAASNEVPEYTGGANFVLAASNDLPEYKGGVNGAEAAIHEVSEYKGETKPVLAAANERPAKKLSLGQDATYQAPAAKQNELPNTGSKENTTLISIGLVAGLLSVLTLGKKRKED